MTVDQMQFFEKRLVEFRIDEGPRSARRVTSRSALQLIALIAVGAAWRNRFEAVLGVSFCVLLYLVLMWVLGESARLARRTCGARVSLLGRSRTGFEGRLGSSLQGRDVFVSARGEVVDVTWRRQGAPPKGDMRASVIAAAQVASIAVLGDDRPRVVRLVQRDSPDVIYVPCLRRWVRRAFANWSSNPWDH